MNLTWKHLKGLELPLTFNNPFFGSFCSVVKTGLEWNVPRKPFGVFSSSICIVELSSHFIGGNSMHIWSTDSSVGVEVRRTFWFSLMLMPPFDGFSDLMETSFPFAETSWDAGIKVCISYISSDRMVSAKGDVVGGNEDCSLLIIPLLFLQMRCRLHTT